MTWLAGQIALYHGCKVKIVSTGKETANILYFSPADVCGLKGEAPIMLLKRLDGDIETRYEQMSKDELLKEFLALNRNVPRSKPIASRTKRAKKSADDEAYQAFVAEQTQAMQAKRLQGQKEIERQKEIE